MFTPYNLSHSYRAVGPDELTGFPSPMGVSGNWIPATITLAAHKGSGTLELVSDPPYDSALHDSKGIAPGTFQFDRATRTTLGWGGAITRYLQSAKPCLWKPAEPQGGTFQLVADISVESAAAVRVFEREHIEDFQHAWESSFGLVADLLPKCSAGSTEKTIEALVTHLIGVEAAYVIPADPDDLNNWGPRILAVYRELCNHSYKRDDKGHHSPTRYEFTVIGDSIHVRFVPGPNHPSKEYVIPGEIRPVFTAASYAEHVQRKATTGSAPAVAGANLPDGTEVVWSDEAAGNVYDDYPAGLGPGEQMLHAAPSPDAQWVTDIGPINYVLHTDKGTVVARDATHVWVKINLWDRSDSSEASWLPRAAKPADFPNGDAYVRLRPHLLKPKPRT